MYSTRGDNKLGTLYAAANVPASAEVLRSGPAPEIREWCKNWDFREPHYGGRAKSDKNVDRNRVPSLAEINDEQKPASNLRPNATRHLLFIRHGQYVSADEDEKRVLTPCGRFVLHLSLFGLQNI